MVNNKMRKVKILAKTLKKPPVGIILGDQAGIGPEIVLKLLLKPKIYDLCYPLLIGNYELLFEKANRIAPDLFFNRITIETIPSDINKLFIGGIPVIDVGGDVSKVRVGEITGESGMIAYKSIVQAYSILKKGYAKGIVMAPINKEALAKSGCGYQSEYELFAYLAGVDEVQTVVKGGDVFRSSVIGHIPFREILSHLTTEKIIQTGVGLNNVMNLFGNTKKRIAVAALNPHGGEGGLLGTEEFEIIVPAIKKLNKMGIDTLGPYPADTIFNRAMNGDFEGVVHLYHDQGNIAMKTQMFESTAIIYTNVPFPVLSTGHGSALDIADLGIANPTNLSYVFTTFSEIYRNTYNEAKTRSQPTSIGGGYRLP